MNSNTLALGIAEFSLDQASIKTKEFFSVLRTYSNDDLEDQRKIIILAATIGFLVQVLCKRIAENSDEEHKLESESIKTLGDLLQARGGKPALADFVNDIINQTKETLSKPGSTVHLVYLGTLLRLNLPVPITENYVKNLLESLEEFLYDLKSSNANSN